MKNQTLHRADLLRAAKKNKNNISLRVIAQATGVSVNTLRAAFDGSAPVNADKLKIISDFLEVDWLHLHDLDAEIVPLVACAIEN